MYLGSRDRGKRIVETSPIIYVYMKFQVEDSFSFIKYVKSAFLLPVDLYHGVLFSLQLRYAAFFLHTWAVHCVHFGTSSALWL
jgi:hypothetical protein